MLLGDLGGEVIKVESPGGDDTRSWIPPVRQDGVSTYFSAINRNKKSIAMDFDDSEDLAVAQRLAARADIVVENFKPGSLRRFGLDYDAVATANPSVVYCSISGFGTGHGSSLPGYDLIVQAMSGLMSLTTVGPGPRGVARVVMVIDDIALPIPPNVGSGTPRRTPSLPAPTSSRPVKP